MNKKSIETIRIKLCNEFLLANQKLEVFLNE